MFTTLDLLARVVAAKPAGFFGFHALAIDDASTGRGFEPLGNADRHEQIMVDGLSQTTVPPCVEIALHRGQ